MNLQFENKRFFKENNKLSDAKKDGKQAERNKIEQALFIYQLI